MKKLLDYFLKKKRVDSILETYKKEIDYLLLMVPSHSAYLIWNSLGSINKTLLLFIGSPYFTSAYHNNNIFMYFFRRVRSSIHDYKMKVIINNTDSIIMANSPSLIDLWGAKFNRKINLVKTSSLSNAKYDYPVIENRVVDGFTLLDWTMVLQNAKEIHTVPTAISFIVDVIDTEAQVFYYPNSERQYKDVIDIFNNVTEYRDA